MARSTHEIIAELNAFQPDDFAEHWLSEGWERLYDVCDELINAENPEQGSDTLFALFERLEGKDLGSPGPIVHALEKLPNYGSKLVSEVQRKPTTYTVRMLNRILNSQLPPERRQFLLGLLTATLSHPSASEATQTEAQNFIEYQRSKTV